MSMNKLGIHKNGCSSRRFNCNFLQSQRFRVSPSEVRRCVVTYFIRKNTFAGRPDAVKHLLKAFSSMNSSILRPSRIIPKRCLAILVKHRNLANESAARTLDRKQIKADQDYCVDLVQKRDREGYRKCFLNYFS